ncbi:RING-type domain-containing protein [Meloidogyne graminicola]|uniref:RING-type domain-containing protein n=1 Tax=Meloidogyne graminicola TaxID=189291 RepID=A0A8S9ZGI7_9BILA|nr:RING-type domain-containing protein [Meloidogyne graminicola]
MKSFLSSELENEKKEQLNVNIEKEQFNNPLEQIERLLTCPICLDRYKQPKLLQCQHTFCLSCLENYVESNGGRPQVKCPECRFEHLLPLDGGGVHSLQNNLTLLSFLEIHMEASSEVNAEEINKYIQRFNMERCRVCEEKSELELCVHCERKCCSECRNSHLDMLKRDLNRLLGQVRRLSARVKEASNGIGRGLENILTNGEQTKQEISEYFNRYQRELKIKEENFIEQVNLFIQNEERLLRTLRDTLDVEWNNLQDACLWVDSVLNGQRLARDDELARFKLEFQQGLDYLRSFQPDSDELFAKKLRFSPGDDAAKLPTAIANFGELSISLPQFANRYLPLEQQYLPKPFRMGLESDNFIKFQKRGENNKLNYREEKNNLENENIGINRWRIRKELENESLNRLSPFPHWSSNSSHSTSNRASPMPQLQIDIGGISSSKLQTNISPTSNKLKENEGNVDNKTIIKTSTTEQNIISPNHSPKHNSTTTLDISKTLPKQQQQQSQQKQQTQQKQNKQLSGIPSLTTTTKTQQQIKIQIQQQQQQQQQEAVF